MEEERRRTVRKLQLSREKILANYRDAVPEALEGADGKQRGAVYNTLAPRDVAQHSNLVGHPIKVPVRDSDGKEDLQPDPMGLFIVHRRTR
jgi:hypothetical protein